MSLRASNFADLKPMGLALLSAWATLQRIYGRAGVAVIVWSVGAQLIGERTLTKRRIGEMIEWSG